VGRQRNALCPAYLRGFPQQELLVNPEPSDMPVTSNHCHELSEIGCPIKKVE
jgi:hypothetical protein